MNCSLFNDVFYKHTHSDSDVLLYYVNMEWKEEWYGETVFQNEDGSILYTQKYKPCSAVWFDGSIPHLIKPQSATAPKFRFSVSIFFKRNDNGERFQKCICNKI